MASTEANLKCIPDIHVKMQDYLLYSVYLQIYPISNLMRLQHLIYLHLWLPSFHSYEASFRQFLVLKITKVKS